MLWAEISLFRTFTKSLAISSLRETMICGKAIAPGTIECRQLPAATSLSSCKVPLSGSGAQPWRSAGLMATRRPPLAPGCRYSPRHPSRNTHQATPLPAGALKSYLRVHSAAARRLPRPAPPSFLLDTVAISAALMTHLGNALKAECFLGTTSDSQMKTLCILAST